GGAGRPDAQAGIGSALRSEKEAMRFLLIFLLLIPLSVRAEDAPITGTYSSLYYNEKGGELLGAEVTIIKRAKGYEAEFQVAQGGRPDKVTVPVSVKGNRISFT